MEAVSIVLMVIIIGSANALEGLGYTRAFQHFNFLLVSIFYTQDLLAVSLNILNEVIFDVFISSSTGARGCIFTHLSVYLLEQ